MVLKPMFLTFKSIGNSNNSGHSNRNTLNDKNMQNLPIFFVFATQETSTDEYVKHKEVLC